MATRHLRRIQEQLGQEKRLDVVINGSEDEEGTGEVALEQKKHPFNPFDLLSDDVRQCAFARAWVQVLRKLNMKSAHRKNPPTSPTSKTLPLELMQHAQHRHGRWSLTLEMLRNTNSS